MNEKDISNQKRPINLIAQKRHIYVFKISMTITVSD